VGDSFGQRYGVFGVFSEVGSAENAFLKQFEDYLPTHESSVGARRLASAGLSFDVLGNPMDPTSKRRLASMNSVSQTFTGTVDFKLLYDGVDLKHYFSYDGSFTTPPCTEAVEFYIMIRHASLTSAQLNKFKYAMGWNSAGGNFRPPQPIGSRRIYGCTLGPSAFEDLDWYPYNASVWATSVGALSRGICESGSEQSPIDFEECASPQDRDSIEISWVEQPVELINNGHTLQITAKGNSPGEPGKMTVRGKKYTLVKCHFHWGSEHIVAGAQFPFEAHCVHK